MYAIRHRPTRPPVGDLCRQLGESEATFYAWKKRSAHLGVSELRRLRQLEEEHRRLKRLVADLSLDQHRLSEALRKKVCGPPAAGNSPSGFSPRSRCGVRGPAGWRHSVEPPGIDEVGRRIHQDSGYAFAIWPTPGPGSATYGTGWYGGAQASS